MSKTNRRGGGPGAGATAVPDQPVMLVRHRARVANQPARTVHLVPLPETCEAGSVGTLCGALLSTESLEIVTLGEGAPCTMCILNRAATTMLPPVGNADSAEPRCAADYETWNWPVTRHRDQIRLNLHQSVTAIAIPITIISAVIELLTAQHCAPAVLAHPYCSAHRIVLTGEAFWAALPWPTGVHRVTGALMLPPTVTPRGPVTWVQSPREDSLRLSREIDVFGALRAVLSTSPPR